MNKDFSHEPILAQYGGRFGTKGFVLWLSLIEIDEIRLIKVLKKDILREDREHWWGWKEGVSYHLFKQLFVFGRIRKQSQYLPVQCIRAEDGKTSGIRPYYSIIWE